MVSLKDLLKSIGYLKKKTYMDYSGLMKTHINYPHGNNYGWMGNSKNFKKYVDIGGTPIIAYNINPLGLIVMFKGKKKIFCYVVLKDGSNFWVGGFDYKIGRLTYKRFFKLLKEKETTILDKELYNKAKFKVIEEKI